MNNNVGQTEGVARIVTLLGEIGNVEGIGVDEDFYDAGFSSIGSLQLLMELEDKWSVSIPDEEFIQARTPRALHILVSRLIEAAQ
jgi:acyl carrier protein